MKFAKRVFAIIFLAAYVLFAGNALLSGGGGVLKGALSGFPSREGMHYYANTAAYQALPLRTALLQQHASLQTLFGKTESGGLDVIAANDGAFVEGWDTAWNAYTFQQFAVRLSELQENLQDRGLATQVVYISAQPQIVNGYTQGQRPIPLPDEYPMMESLLYYLRAYGVDFLDTQFVLQHSGVPVSQYIYKTDTKWTNQAAFATAQALVGKLNGQYKAGIDPGWQLFDGNHFTATTYTNGFMGTMGMRAGEAFTGREDFVTILPQYETDFTYEAIGESEVLRTGPFEETLFNAEHLNPPNLYAYSAYSVYMDGGAQYYRIISNRQQPEAPKALFVHDASALPFAAFTALGFSETHMYWPGIAPGAAEFTIAEYVETNDIDYVFFLAECDYYALEDIFTADLY